MLDRFSIKNSLQAEHTVGGRVLRTNVNHIIVSAEEAILLGLQVTILIQIILQTIVRFHIVLQCVLIVELPVLAEGIALKV